MHSQLALDGAGLAELDGAAMLAVNGGGLIDWPEIVGAALVTLVTCILKSSDSLVDGVQAGWAAY